MQTVDKIHYPFMIKTPSNLGTEKNFLSLIKGIYKKCTANIILNGKRQKAFLVRQGTTQESILPLLFKLYWNSQNSKARMRTQMINIEKGEIKHSLLINGMFICRENPEESTINLLRQVSLTRIWDTKSTHLSSILVIVMKTQKPKSLNIPFVGM